MGVRIIRLVYDCSAANTERIRTPVKEPEAKEAWRSVDDAVAEAFKQSHFRDWDFGIGEVVRNSTNMLKVRLRICLFYHTSNSLQCTGWLIRSARIEHLAQRSCAPYRRRRPSYQPGKRTSRILRHTAEPQGSIPDKAPTRRLKTQTCSSTCSSNSIQMQSHLPRKLWAASLVSLRGYVSLARLIW